MRCLYREYRWAILPLLVLLALQVNIRLYYDLGYGYDMPQHYSNARAVMLTGWMPPPPLTPSTYEAFQAPLFYVLSAGVIRLGELFAPDGFRGFMPLALGLVTLIWALLIVVWVQEALGKCAPPLVRALTVLVVMLFPANVLLGAMFSNDLPLAVCAMLTVYLLWRLARAGRLHDGRAWLVAGAAAATATAFKNNGIIVGAVYVVLAGLVIAESLWKRRRNPAREVARALAIALPLILLPFIFNARHTMRYVPDPMGAVIPPRSAIGRFPLRFFVGFDFSIFENPFAYGPGEGSFWSLQYVTLHSDYYNHWNSPAYNALPPDQRHDTGHNQPMPVARFDALVRLQVLAIPITLVMVYAVLHALYRSVRRPHAALRDGALLILLLALAGEGAQLLRFVSYADVRAVLIHARFLSFLYVALFIAGITWLWERWGARRDLLPMMLKTVLVLDMLAYTVTVVQALWLPAV